MNHSLVALAFQETAPDNFMWIIIGIVLFLLVFIVVIVVVGLVIFFIMRKRKKARLAASSAPSLASDYSPGGSVPSYSEAPVASAPEIAVAVDAPPPSLEPPTPQVEMRAGVSEASPVAAPPAPSESAAADFDPSRTVAITRENTVSISYGLIKFVSGVLAGQEFEVQPEGSYIGRESSLSQIVVADPRISKRHLWIGVRDGQVTIVDQDSRNGTFVNDPKSERITEATLHTGDTVILGESDVARFEYQM